MPVGILVVTADDDLPWLGNWQPSAKRKMYSTLVHMKNQTRGW
jgi:hypothetical protein